MINEKPSKAGQGRQTKAKEGVRPRPASEEERQVGGRPRPASEEERQVGGRPRPASEEERQVGGRPRPASEEERQVGGRPRPAVNKTRSCQRLDEFFFFFQGSRVTAPCQFRPFPPQGKTQTRETGWREDRND